MDENNQGVKALFFDYGGKEKGYITQDIFLIFYEAASMIKPWAVRLNLTQFGYRPDLVKFDKDDEGILLEYDKLPRFVLSNDEKYFKLICQLFGILLLYKK